ncbi:variably expressed lipoprotein and hemagglutinin (VlhA) family protein [Mycoplasmoides gallisepticum CA06_2006.052-5-2P]|uniref:FIVAR domain-containing protein n=1 Tax=Mycoplasmoides gallisepticum TaxID=2096 RepID=UPI0002778D00|nr:FIVAR domain-containing protein [Mycoplasmoides gallisepticum]AFP77906.1 variably expressed lipoprotein and hemagglutinin (VlhA) family protein [Mycoplasmoides gallisepticum NC96_1596-4-2P]AFP80905.1 variably expressed lipoprotein and hemagglutinin (VlhA) family protein [Mycoplasmoides gallisepticum CA06_2006.052-5-2P]
MKRKNILKFVSLLGIGSFVMLAAASCTTPVNPTPNPKPTPNPEPKPDPMPNPPSGGMNGGDTNPGDGQGMMDSAAQELTAARTALTSLLASKNANVQMYSDYAKIKNDLTAAYTSAETASQNQAATLEQVKSATSTLQTAINTAVNEKKVFDENNSELVTAYTNLKTTLEGENTTLAAFNDSANYGGIKTHLMSLYNQAKTITTSTLLNDARQSPNKDNVVKINKEITDAINPTLLNQQKANADMLATSFTKQVLNDTQLTSGSSETSMQTQPQPGNYSFVGYSVDVTTGSNNARPNWNFAQRKVWDTNKAPLTQTEQSNKLTNVSWIYNLSGMGAKYTVTFDYYGASNNAYLYFPYKLVQTNDKVALQYSLNGIAPKAIEFKAAAATQAVPAQEGASATHQDSSSESSSPPAAAAPSEAEARVAETPANPPATSQDSASADQTMSTATTMNEAPTVDSINVAKVTLTDLKFGQNTIEFSVPTGDDHTSKVAPMIGNMYLTANDQNVDKVYDDIFGNTVANQDNATEVSVDLLKGYSLATSYSIYVRRFTNLTESGEGRTAISSPVYLVGWIGGDGARTNDRSVENVYNFPAVNGNSRTLTVYVNAPKTGDYNISGSYISTTTERKLKISTDNKDSNSVTIGVRATTAWNTLEKFDTSATMNSLVTITNEKKTLHLEQGLNKIIIGGVSGHTPYIGNLKFTLNNPSPTNAENNTNTRTEQPAGEERTGK